MRVSKNSVTGEKLCSKCCQPGTFTKNKAEPDGLQKWCAACRKAWAADYYQKNKKKISKRCKDYRSTRVDQYKAYEAVSKARYPDLTLIRHAGVRARAKGLPFNLKTGDVPIPTHCPLLGVELQVGKGKVGPFSPTLDRKVPALGYVKGNVWVISHRANAMKNDASLEELELLTKNLRIALTTSS